MGIVSAVTKLPVAKTVIGVDASTKSVAFSVFRGGKCIDSGKLTLDSPSIEESCGDANKRMHELIKTYKPDMLVIEKAVFVNNTKVAIQLGNIFGAIIGVAAAQGIICLQAPPFDWLRYIGNSVKSNAAAIKTEQHKTPGKSKNWYKQQIRLQRKQFTIDWVNKKHDLNIDDDDIADAIAVGDYGYNVLSTRK